MRGYCKEFKDQVLKAILVDQMPIKQACRVFHLSRDTVIQKILNGASKKEVANKFGKSHMTIYFWLREYENQQMSLKLEEYQKIMRNQDA